MMNIVLRQKINVKSSYADICCCIFITGIFAVKALIYAAVEIFGDYSAFQISSKVAQALLLLVALWVLITKRCRALLITEAVLAIIYIVSLLMGNASTSLILNVWFYGAVLYIPMGIAAYNIEEKQLLIKWFYRMSWVVFLVLLASVAAHFFLGTGSSTSSYDMSFGYLMLIPVLCFLGRYARARSILDLIMAIIGSGTILLYGSRGPFLCILGYIVLMFLFSREMKPRWKAGNLIMIGGLLTVAIICWNRILDVLYRLLGAVGVSSRSMKLLLNSEAVTHSSGRDVLFSASMDALNQAPIMGWGAESAQNIVGNYPHDIFVELLFSFGYPIGILACMVLIVVAIRGLMQLDNWDREASILFIACSMVLLVSWTFLDTWQFFVCMGLCLSGASRLKVKRKYGTQSLNTTVT